MIIFSCNFPVSLWYQSIILALQHEFGNVIFSLASWRTLEVIGMNRLWMSDGIHPEAFCPWALLCWEVLVTDSISFAILGVLSLSVSP